MDIQLDNQSNRSDKYVVYVRAYSNKPIKKKSAINNFIVILAVQKEKVKSSFL